MPSLRARLVIGTALTLAAILAAAGVTLYVLMRASLVAEFDTALAREAAAITSLTEQDGDTVEVEPQTAGVAEFTRSDQPHYFEIWAADGGSLARSASLASTHLPYPAHLDPSGEASRYEPMRLPTGEDGRAVVLRFAPRNEGAAPPMTLTLALARDTRHLRATLARLGWLLFGVSAAAAAAGAGAAAWVVGRGLRPLRSLAGAIGRVGADDLSERIDPAANGGTPREVAPVVQRLNELLARVQAAVERERAFTADVAHELRTPLAGLSTLLEVCASRPRDTGAYEAVVDKSLGVTRGMQAMVNNLLLLARADCDQLAPSREPVDVPALLRECWAAHAEDAARRGLRIEWDVATGEAAASADPALLRMIASNVFANAVAYADEGGRVTVRVRPRGSAERSVSVSNTGSRIARGDAERVFDRFWRGDTARTDAGARCGLGLPLCRKLAEVLGGQIRATSAEGIFTVELTLPVYEGETRHPHAPQPEVAEATPAARGE